MRRALVLLALLAAPAQAQQAVPIPSPLEGPIPRYEGAAAAARPLTVRLPPHNPALAADGRSGSGLAAGNGAATPYAGPLGRLPQRSSALQPGACSSLALDARDRLLTVCTAPTGPALKLLDPATLDTIASLALPAKPSPAFSDPLGGPHFVVRADGTLLVPANDGTVRTIAVGEAALTQTASVEVAAGERLVAVAAGYDGFDWVAGADGTIAALPRDGSAPKTISLGEPIAEDMAMARSGAYVVTDAAAYRLRAGADGTPEVVWRHVVPATAPDAKNGKLHEGSGTPPAIVRGGYVAIADVLDPPRLTILRTGGPDARRLHCAVPLFRKQGHGSVEAHLVVAGDRVVASNAYGYEGPRTTEGGGTTLGGIAQIRVGRRGCRTVWRSGVISPSAQATVSLATGLLYTVDKPKAFPDRWNLAALDWRTGKLRYRSLAGEGLGFNSNNGAVLLGPDGAAYAASFGGVARWADLG